MKTRVVSMVAALLVGACVPDEGPPVVYPETCDEAAKEWVCALDVPCWKACPPVEQKK